MLKIEKSIMELLDLLEMLNQQVVQQGQVIQDVADKTEQTTEQLGGANVHIEKGVRSALRARKLKWWCLGVCVLICIVIALGVGLGVALTKPAATGGNNNNA
jgi:syntaxin 1B/2/3